MANVTDAFRGQLSPEVLANLEAVLARDFSATMGGGAVALPAATAWLTATGYTEGDLTTNGGSTYIATQTHTSGASSEPGVGVDQADFWEPLVAATNSLTVVGGAVASDILLPVAGGLSGHLVTIKNIGPANVTVKLSGSDDMRDEDGGTIASYVVSGSSSKQFMSDGGTIWDVL